MLFFNGWIAEERTQVADILHADNIPPPSFVFFTMYGVLMSCLSLRLLTAQISTSYSRLLTESAGFAVLSAASFSLQLESVLSLKARKRYYDAWQFENRVSFDRMDLGPAGGIAMFDPLSRWPNVENDRVIRETGLAGPAEPWPMPPETFSIEDRITGLDAKVRQIIVAVTTAADLQNNPQHTQTKKKWK